MKCVEHFKTITKHKCIVAKNMIKCGYVYRGLMHDNSKYSPIEFWSSVKYFTGKRSPIELEKEDRGISYCWINHRTKNKHHWEYWVDWEDGVPTPRKIPYKYVVEMVCDYIAAGKVYMKDSWNQQAPLNYYVARQNNLQLHTDTRELFYKLLFRIYDKGLDSFYKLAKDEKLKMMYNQGNLVLLKMYM